MDLRIIKVSAGAESAAILLPTESEQANALAQEGNDLVAVELGSSWFAQIELQLAFGKHGTSLSRSRHCGPLYVQKPFYPEGPELAHIYLLHPPGGIVSGDHLSIEIDATANSKALVTTPGAARIYRARDTSPLQRQQVTLRLGTAASLEWFPLETIAYSGSCVELETTIELNHGSRFIGWEITCFGLPASGEPYQHGSFQQRYKVSKNGLPLFIDSLSLSDKNSAQFFAGVAGMRGLSVSGFALFGPFDDSNVDKHESIQAQLTRLREASIAQGFENVAAISRVGNFFVGRYLGGSTEHARKVFTAWWQILRPSLLGRTACAPRIWSC